MGYASIAASLLTAVGVLCFMKAVESGRRVFYAATWGCLITGTLTHEIGIGLPAICAVYSLVRVENGSFRRRFGYALRRTWPGWLLIVGYLTARLSTVGPIADIDPRYTMSLSPSRREKSSWLPRTRCRLMGNRRRERVDGSVV